MQKGEDEDIFILIVLGLILGARLGSVFIYSHGYYFKHPIKIFWPFENGHFVGLPGMSYHGGVIGAILFCILAAKKHKIKFFDIADNIIISIPFAYTFGRLGNFCNAELYGRATTSALGMIFPNAEKFSTSLPWVQDIAKKLGMDYLNCSTINLPRHPSQLYEALFEGVILGLIMWFIVRPSLKKIKSGSAIGLYLSIYGVFRFIIEYFRQPDSDMGYIVSIKHDANVGVFESILNISMGQILCLLMVAVGLLFVFWPAKWNKAHTV